MRGAVLLGGFRAVGGAALLVAAAVAGGEPLSAPRSVGDARLRSMGRAELAQSWLEAEAWERQARALERDQPAEAVQRYLDAARRFEGIAHEQGGSSQPLWRSARSYWLAGDTLPVDSKLERVRYFEAAEALCDRGIAVDPECAECMLWKFAAMGRLGTARGIWVSSRQLPEMAGLLDRAIALEPAYSEEGENSTLGNLHYSSAIFYRVLPDWFWIGWLIGVRGDKDRALAHVRTARSIHPDRLDYQIELGSQLLCLGSSRGDPKLLVEGRRVMRAAMLREPETQDDAREILAARIMLDEPRKSCGYSGDAWIEIDSGQARRAAKGEGRQSPDGFQAGSARPE